MRTKTKRARRAPPVANVPLKRVRISNILYGKHSILIKEVEDHAYLSPKDREGMKNFEERPSQLAAAKEISEKLLCDDKNKGSVLLVYPNRSGKTIIANMAIRRFCAMAQKNPSTEGATLVLYSKAKVDNEQARLVGAFTDIALSTNGACKDSIRDEIARRGSATIMLSDRGLRNILNTNVLFDGKVSEFCDLDAEEFSDVEKLKTSLKYGDVPYVLQLVKELNIRNVVVICDEVHTLLKTNYDSRLRLLANNKKMSTMSASPCPFNMFVLGMSATPGAKDTINCSTSKFYANRMLFTTLEPFPKNVPLIDLEELEALEKTICVRSDSVAVTGEFTNWAGFEGSGIRNESGNRTRCIQDPSNATIVERVAKMCVMNALIPARQTDKDWSAVRIKLECANGTSIEYATRMPPKKDPKTLCLTSKALDATTRSYLSDMDASLFLQGRLKDRPHTKDTNPICPKRVRMREVTEVHNHAGGRVTATFNERNHFHTILLAVDCCKESSMAMSRAAAAELNDDPGYNSIVFDLVDANANVMNEKLDVDVKRAVKEDNAQVIILVRSIDVEGMSLFSKYVTMTVFCGYNRDHMKQAVNRMARQPAPILGMIVPMTNVGYVALSACSDMSSNVVPDTHSCIDCVLSLPKNDECRKLFLSMRERDQASSSKFARHLFVLFADKNRSALKVDDLCPNLRFTNSAGQMYKTLYKGFKHLYSERARCALIGDSSNLWGETFAGYLEMMAGLRSKTYGEDDE